MYLRSKSHLLINEAVKIQENLPSAAPIYLFLIQNVFQLQISISLLILHSSKYHMITTIIHNPKEKNISLSSDFQITTGYPR